MLGCNLWYQRAGDAVSMIALRQSILQAFDLQNAGGDLLKACEVFLLACVFLWPRVKEPYFSLRIGNAFGSNIENADAPILARTAQLDELGSELPDHSINRGAA